MCRWILFLLPISLLLSCSSYKEVTYTNRVNYQESTYNYEYPSRNYVYSTNDNINNSDNVDIDKTLVETENLSINEKSKSNLIIKNDDALKTDNLIENESNLSYEKDNKDKDDKDDKDKNKVEKKEKKILFDNITILQQEVIKWSLIVANLIVLIISPPLGLITISLTISIVGCILYPIWYKKGYLDTPYAKIAVFIATYVTFIANLFWILY